MTKLLLAACVVVVSASCRSSAGGSSQPEGAATPSAAPAPAAVAADYYPYSKPGTASINGQAFVVVRGGDVLLDGQGYLTTISDNARTASGSDVTLDPATPFAMDWYMKSGTSLRRFANTPKDAAFRAARRTVVADESGKFTFTNLPAGRYIVRTTITWQTPRDSYRMMTQGGVASAVIELVEGEAKTVVLRHVSETP